MRPLEDMIGQRFGMLLVEKRVLVTGKSGGTVYQCLCDCGKSSMVRASNLKNGHSRSCGCMKHRPERWKGSSLKHGHTRGNQHSREYSAWCNAKSRCYRETCTGYKNYGGKGIRMCDGWRDSFENFLHDMGPCWNGRYLLRKNKKGDYEPENCYWGSSGVKRREIRTVTVGSAYNG